MTKGFFFVISAMGLIHFFCLPSVYADRPLSTEEAFTVEKGQFKLETGFEFARQDNHDREINPSVTLTYGLLENVDIGVGSSYLFARPKEGENENGIGDTEIELKYQALGEKTWMPAFAVSGSLKVPTASDAKGLGSGKADFGINAIFSKELSNRFLLHLNVGYAFIGERGADNEMNYSGAVQFILSDKWTVAGEIVGVNNFNGAKRDDPVSGLIGATYLVTDQLVWDAGVEIGMSKAAPDYRITTGLTYLFKP